MGVFGCPHRAQPGPRGKGEACLVAWFSCWACIARSSKQPRAWLVGNPRIDSFSRARLSAARGRTGGSEARAREDGGRWKSGAPSRHQISSPPFTRSPIATVPLSSLLPHHRRRLRFQICAIGGGGGRGGGVCGGSGAPLAVGHRLVDLLCAMAPPTPSSSPMPVSSPPFVSSVVRPLS